jgi:hypothetical protein
VRWAAVAAAALAPVVVLVWAYPANADRPGSGPRHIDHVRLLCIDGLHQSDLTWWVSHHPTCTLAAPG